MRGEHVKTFADRLMDTIEKKQNPSDVGLDPRFESIPESIRNEQRGKYGETFEAVGASIYEFNRGIIDAVKDIVPAVKPQMAFYEQYGYHGVKAFMDTAEYARKSGLIVIGDVKRNDIGSTARAYSDGHLGTVEFWNGQRAKSFDVDAITVNAYLGSDGVKPFVEDVKNHSKGIFVLVKTSNPSSGELQDLVTQGGETNYVVMARNVHAWGDGTQGERGYQSVGAVVGATYPKDAEVLRGVMPKSYFLVPGYGAQGGGAADAMPSFNKDGYGAIVNSSRGIIFAYQKGPFKRAPEEYAAAAAASAQAMKDDLTKAMKEAGICPW
jgi:orotidine-5'-phosphate decarboxylase